MAKSADIRPGITLACTECKERNYITTKNRRPTVLSSRSFARAAASRPCTARLVDRKYHSFTKPGPFGRVFAYCLRRRVAGCGISIRIA